MAIYKSSKNIQPLSAVTWKARIQILLMLHENVQQKFFRNHRKPQLIPQSAMRGILMEL